MATLTETIFPECPERKHSDPNFVDYSFLSSEIDDPVDKPFKVDDLEISDDNGESQDEHEEEISSSCKFKIFWIMLSQLLIFCCKCRKASHIEKTKIRGSLLEVTLMCLEGRQTHTFNRRKNICDVLSLSIAKIPLFLYYLKYYFYIKQRNKIVSEMRTHIAVNVICDGQCD